MKLRNKLIPLASVAGVAAVVAPISLTSCVGSDMVNLIDGYIPYIESLSNDVIRKEFPNGYTEYDIYNFYFEQIQKNPEILVQDLLWSETVLLNRSIILNVSNEHNAVKPINSSLAEMYGSVKNVAVKSYVKHVDNQDVSIWTVSLDQKIKFTANAGKNIKRKDAGNIIPVLGLSSTTYEYNIHFKDVPIRLLQRQVGGTAPINVLGTDWVFQVLEHDAAKQLDIPYEIKLDGKAIVETTHNVDGRTWTTTQEEVVNESLTPKSENVPNSIMSVINQIWKDTSFYLRLIPMPQQTQE